MDYPRGEDLDELTALFALAEEGSFTAAGRALGRHSSIISKRIAALEARIGVRLVERTTRQMRLTEAGLALAQDYAQATGQIAAAQEAAARGAAQIRGRLRIALPAAMGRMWIAPALPRLLARHPELSLELNFSETFVDMIGEGYDAALRIGALKDSRLSARKLADHRRILTAAPEYAARHGLPQAPAELAQHPCLEFTGFAAYPVWRLSDGRATETVAPHGPMRSNDSQALLEAARAGLGILGAGEWLTAPDVAAGRLVRVLPGWSFDIEGGIYLVRPSARYPAPRTEAFLRWMTELFQPGPPWQGP
ncbi:LysR family transcriptional regulator [Paenirhodobacter sp.]|uniref:LysR family transcriptional regulator n=1 Tax=Paenirhodobacter sp. TaxID=1965326 RepID=UPI003B513148